MCFMYWKTKKMRVRFLSDKLFFCKKSRAFFEEKFIPQERSDEDKMPSPVQGFNRVF